MAELVTFPDAVDVAIQVVPAEHNPMLAKEYGQSAADKVRERMAALARRARKWAMLSRKKNGDKKVAIIFHNYPPDNSHIGSASQIGSSACQNTSS